MLSGLPLAQARGRPLRRRAPLVSARSLEHGLEPALVAALAESSHAQVLSPAALSEQGVGELLAAGLGSPNR